MKMGQTQNFFKKKKGWSLLKDRIVDFYLEPYIAKILSTNKPLYIIDCFAGKGKFDCGSPGSPIIIGTHIKEILDNENKANKNISGIFIEKKYSMELKECLSNYNNCKVLEGTFQENLERITDLDESSNVFLYVDPYGPKSIPFKPFQKIKEKNFFSLELLMNFNSFGFLREGSRILKYNEAFNAMEKEDENDEGYEIEEANDIDEMNSIANGVYWTDIITKYKDNQIDMFQAEEIFTKKYTKEVEKLFKYVINIPIKTKSNLLPKYRLIFGTNHEDGLILMANQMNKAWKKILEGEREGQEVLFEYIFPDLSVNYGFNLEADIINLIDELGGEISLKPLKVKLIQKYGISFSEQDYHKKLQELDGNVINIVRDPEFTKTGKKATAMNDRLYKITLRLA